MFLLKAYGHSKAKKPGHKTLLTVPPKGHHTFPFCLWEAPFILLSAVIIIRVPFVPNVSQFGK